MLLQGSPSDVTAGSCDANALGMGSAGGSWSERFSRRKVQSWRTDDEIAYLSDWTSRCANLIVGAMFPEALSHSIPLIPAHVGLII